MNQGFNKDMKSLMTFNTPATPHKGILLNKETNTKYRTIYRRDTGSGVGSLLYLVKHLQPKLSNVVRELSKCMYESKMIHYKAILRSKKCVIDTKYYCYQMKPYGNTNRPWEIHG